jgi:hypothetical protein
MNDKGVNPPLASLTEVDRLVHEPARLAVMSLLYVIDSADFTFLMNQTGADVGQSLRPHEQARGGQLCGGGKELQGAPP